MTPTDTDTAREVVPFRTFDKRDDALGVMGNFSPMITHVNERDQAASIPLVNVDHPIETVDPEPIETDNPAPEPVPTTEPMADPDAPENPDSEQPAPPTDPSVDDVPSTSPVSPSEQELQDTGTEDQQAPAVAPDPLAPTPSTVPGDAPEAEPLPDE